jgi:hypothetical protein
MDAFLKADGLQRGVLGQIPETPLYAMPDQATAGDTHLGGEDFDNRLVNFFVQVQHPAACFCTCIRWVNTRETSTIAALR